MDIELASFKQDKPAKPGLLKLNKKIVLLVFLIKIKKEGTPEYHGRQGFIKWPLGASKGMTSSQVGLSFN